MKWPGPVPGMISCGGTERGTAVANTSAGHEAKKERTSKSALPLIDRGMTWASISHQEPALSQQVTGAQSTSY